MSGSAPLCASLSRDGTKHTISRPSANVPIDGKEKVLGCVCVCVVSLWFIARIVVSYHPSRTLYTSCRVGDADCWWKRNSTAPISSAHIKAAVRTGKSSSVTILPGYIFLSFVFIFIATMKLTSALERFSSSQLTHSTTPQLWPTTSRVNCAKAAPEIVVVIARSTTHMMA